MSDKNKKSSSVYSSSYIQKILNSLDFSDFPLVIKEILQEKIGDDISLGEIVFEEDEVKTISVELLPFIKDLHIKVEEEKKVFEVVAIVTFESVVKLVSMMFDCLPEDEEVILNPLMQIIIYFNKLLLSDFDFKTRDMICAICEKCCQRQLLQLNSGFIVDTLIFLFDYTLDKDRNILKKDIKRVWNMHNVIFKMNVQGNAFEQLSGKLLQTVESSAYLSCKEGQQFISFLLRFDPKFTKQVHEAIKFFLPDASKAHATAFGKIYYSAWLNANEEQRQTIEKYCIQDLMSRIFVLRRSVGFLDMSRLGKNVLSILSFLHESRRQIHLSKVITELYTPLIWRHIRSGNNIVRCNAVEVFLDVYPLEQPGAGRAEQANLLQRQHNEMADLLTDSCHCVRIIAVQGICNCFKNYWETFPPESIQTLMETMVKEMIYDGSCADVRKAVYQGFSVMLKNPNSAAYLAKVLPSLQNHIHDENEKVRRAFVEMLIQIKELPESFPLRYWKIVPAEHLAERLALENEEVGKLLVKLIMSEFYSPDKPMSAVLKRIYKIILMNHEAAKKLFAFSKKVLSLEASVKIMLNILVVMNKRLKELEESNVENESPDDCNGNKKKVRTIHSVKRKGRRLLGDGNCMEEESNLDSSTSSNESVGAQTENIASPEPHQLDNPDVCYVFIEIVTVLWCVNSPKLNEDANKSVLNDLQNVCASCIPLFLRHFKGTRVFFAVVHLASLIPVAKLNPVSTISSMCVSQLKGLTENDKKEETEVYVNSLCAWNRGPEILELATDWLDQALRSERLNQSAALRSSARQRKVKFQHCEAKPLLALGLLDIIFSHEMNRIQIMKNYNAIYDIFIFLERIKILIERRMNMDASFQDPVLSDKFLKLCLYRYAKLILILHKPINEDSETSDTSTICTNFVNAPLVFPELINWAIRVLLPKVPDELFDCDDSKDIPLAVSLLEVIGRTGCLMMAANLTTLDSTRNFIDFISSLLQSGCKLKFVDVAFRALKELCENSETHYEQDEERLLRATLPTLFTNIISVLSERNIKKDVFAACITDFTEIRRCFLSLPLGLLRTFGIKSQTLHNIIMFLTTTCIRIIAEDVEENDIFDPTDKIQNLPYCSSFIAGALLTRENISKLWFACIGETVSSLNYSSSIEILGSLSLIHTLSFTKKPKLKEELAKTVKKVYDVVTKFPEVDPDKSTIKSLNTSTHSLNARKLGISTLTEVASKLGCTLT
ncbi:uncharacterized protein LOC142324891 [Lycorma delicatula]|uniref:uncharacterized protein LOC142324891 n=1 Tax=Lycorma delicatula TaxID=130591 RepID=UPI003F519ECC